MWKSFVILFLVALILFFLQCVLEEQMLVPLSTSFFLASVAIGIFLSLEQYRLKLKSEKAETDVKLMTLFTKTMNIAHARSGYVVSEETIEQLFNKGILDKNDFQDLTELNKKIGKAAILHLPVGAAEQVAAITAIGKLGERHEVLREIAIEALKSIKEQDILPKLVTEHLNRLGYRE